MALSCSPTCASCRDCSWLARPSERRGFAGRTIVDRPHADNGYWCETLSRTRTGQSMRRCWPTSTPLDGSTHVWGSGLRTVSGGGFPEDRSAGNGSGRYSTAVNCTRYVPEDAPTPANPEPAEGADVRPGRRRLHLACNGDNGFHRFRFRRLTFRAVERHDFSDLDVPGVDPVSARR